MQRPWGGNDIHKLEQWQEGKGRAQCEQWERRLKGRKPPEYGSSGEKFRFFEPINSM